MGELESGNRLESFARILDNIRAPLLLASRSGRVLKANVASAEALGTTVEALRGSELEAHAPEPKRLREALDRAPQVQTFQLRALDGRRFSCDTRVLDADVLLVRLSGGPEQGPRALALREALTRFDRLAESADEGQRPELVRVLVEESLNALGALAGGLFRLDQAGANLELTVAVRYPEPLADRWRIVPLSSHLPLVQSVKTATPFFLESSDDYAAQFPAFAAAHPEIAKNAFVSVPVMENGHAVGAVILGFSSARAFTDGERRSLIELGARCSSDGTAPAASRLGERSRDRLEYLHAYTGALAEAITPMDVAEAVVDIGMATTSAIGGRLWLVSPDGTELHLARRVGPVGPVAGDVARLSLGKGVATPAADAVERNEAIWLESRAQLAERYPLAAAVLAHEEQASMVSLPLHAHGRCIGALVFGYAVSHRFSEDERAFFQLVSWYAAQALDRARLYESEQRAKELAEASQRTSALVADVGALLASSLEYEEILSAMANAVVPRFATWAVIELVDERIRGTRPTVVHEDPTKVDTVRALRRSWRALPRFEPAIAAVMRTGVPIHRTSLTAASVRATLGDEIADLAEQVGISSALVVPISARGRVLGALLLTRAGAAQPYDTHDLWAAEQLGRNVGLALDNARLFQEAREADRLKDDFLAMLSHELRNPLAPILSALEVMELQASDVFARERSVIVRHVRHVVRLVDDLFDVSRITRGKIRLETERHALGSIIGAATEMAGPLVAQRSHTLDVTPPDGLLEVFADRARLAQAIANLLTNAAKYTQPGGTIEVRADADGHEAVVRVRDSGMGISEDQLPRIFDLFVQLPGDRSQGGLGVGLTVVKSLVTLHGGTVSAHSDGLGRGSEFVIRLPRAALPDA